jgi:hypothetical protein
MPIRVWAAWTPLAHLGGQGATSWENASSQIEILIHIRGHSVHKTEISFPFCEPHIRVCQRLFYQWRAKVTSRLVHSCPGSILRQTLFCLRYPAFLFPHLTKASPTWWLDEWGTFLCHPRTPGPRHSPMFTLTTFTSIEVVTLLYVVCSIVCVLSVRW